MRIIKRDGSVLRVAHWPSAVVLVLLFVAFCWYLVALARSQKPVPVLDANRFEVMARAYTGLQDEVALADEFSFPPWLVRAVSERARQAVRSGDVRWRLIRTPENLAYIMLSMIKVESDGDPKAKGDGGKATGFTQMWLATARQYKKNVTEADLKDPDTHLDLAFTHFEHLLDKYHGNMAMALYSWNRGEARVDGLLHIGGIIENGYAPRVYAAGLKP
jgi:soluble lytic murein transglycosylase-like protein